MSDGKANRHHSFFHLPPFYRVCLWFLPFALALAVLVLLYIRVDNRLKDELETTLTREFGRRVTVIKPSVSFPMKIDGIIVQGDGSIDTQPFLAMYDIQVWLALSSLFSEKTTVTSMRIESAVISIKHSNTLGWSTNGLFPNPPNEKSAIKTIHFANMSLIVNTSNFHVNENFRARLTSEKFGDFSFTFRGKNKNGTLLRTGANSGEPIAALNINFDSVPYIGPAQQFGIRTKYNLKSGEFDLGLNVLVNQKPFRFESEFKIDTPVINLVGEWNYDSGTGNVQGTLDRQTQQFKVEGIGTVAMKAVGLHANITSGTLDWKQASIEGNFDGPWNIKTSVASTQLNCTTNPFVENLTGDLQMSAQVSWDDGLKLNRINSLRGNVAFDAIKTSKVDLKKGSIRANANRQRINFSGSWKQFDGFFSTKKTTVTLNRTFRPTNFQGKLSLKNVNVAKVRAALKLPIREDFFRFSPNWTFTGNLDAYDETVKGG
ncbi:MAG: hypothetical protein JKX97_02945, partial [Candidatus Lindowbacteria bacterium]|nr:hypothetical protein [Candidatus Lindowbacteria bacterium]